MAALNLDLNETISADNTRAALFHAAAEPE